MKLIKLAGAALNQIPFGWDNNRRNIKNALTEARANGVTILGLPELHHGLQLRRRLLSS